MRIKVIDNKEKLKRRKRKTVKFGYSQIQNEKNEKSERYEETKGNLLM